MLVDIQHHIAVHLLVVGLYLGILAVGTGDGCIRAGIVLLLESIRSIVNTDTSHDVQPVCHLISKSGIHHVAVLLVGTKVTVVNPVRVLTDKLAEQVVPVLRVDIACRIEMFKHRHIVVVVATRIEVSRNQRIGIHTLVGHVAVVLDDIACTDIQQQPVAQHTGCVPERKVVTVVTVVGNDTA